MLEIGQRRRVLITTTTMVSMFLGACSGASEPKNDDDDDGVGGAFTSTVTGAGAGAGAGGASTGVGSGGDGGTASTTTATTTTGSGGEAPSPCAQYPCLVGQTVVAAMTPQVGDGHVYWRQEEVGGVSIARTSITGNTATQVVVPKTENADYFVVDDTSVYYLTSNAVKKAPVGGGSPTTLATATSPVPWVLVQDSTHVYWSEGEPKKRVPKDGGPIETVISSNGNSGIMRVAAGWLYFGTLGPNVAELHRVLSDGSGPEEAIISAPDDQGRWGANSIGIYHRMGFSQGSLDIRYETHDGTAAGYLVEDATITDLAVTDQYVFFITYKAVGRVAPQGGPIQGIYTGVTPDEIGADGAVVAWVQSGTEVWVAQ